MKKKYLFGIGFLLLVFLVIIIWVLIPKDRNKNYDHLEQYIDNNMECDGSIFVRDNIGYVHCIGDEGNIIKYEVVGDDIRTKTLHFNFSNTPNISQLHITIDGFDDKFIYLKSVVKMDDSVKDGEYVKCNFKSLNCEYYSGNAISSIKVIKKKGVSTNTFKKYYEVDNRVVYLSNMLDDVYIIKESNKLKLYDYFNKSYQYFDDTINNLTNDMIFDNSFDDGGTTIYKSEEYDISLIKCNTLMGNRDVYIGDYSLIFDSSMCNR